MMDSFTIRVYGLLIDEDRLLLSRENIKGKLYNKLPGGGLELGEGIVDCLKREFMEEAHITIRDIQHYYTTEDFVSSAFDSNVQVISIYYMVYSDEARLIKTDILEDDQILYWKNLSNLTTNEVDLPIDKIVIDKLINGL